MTKRIASGINQATSRTTLRIAAFLVFALSASPVFAQESKVPGVPSSDEILRQLTPEPPNSTTRSRGISIERTGDRPAPSIDLRVNFESGSSQITPEATTVLENLGRALSNPALRNSRFL